MEKIQSYESLDFCPNCGSGEIDWLDPEFSSGYCNLPGKCRTCGATVEEVYFYHCSFALVEKGEE